MPARDFKNFERYLLDSGIRRRYARRAVLELNDHLEDLEADSRAQGMDGAAARNEADRRLGDLRDIADEIVQCQDLKTWPYRYPALARVWFPVAYVALLPATPIIAGIERAPAIARWLTCAALGAAVTAAMMLVLQLSILFA